MLPTAAIFAATPTSAALTELSAHARQFHHTSHSEQRCHPLTDVLRLRQLQLLITSSCQGSWQDAAATAQGCVTRKVPKVPFKVLDAPALQDDFYLNLVDWSSQNVLAVALGPSMYLWSACTAKVSVDIRLNTYMLHFNIVYIWIC
jgi:hypothetical protein